MARRAGWVAVVLVVVANAVFANTAAANMTILDPDAFSAGTLLNNEFDGFSLDVTGAGQGSTDGNVYAVEAINNPGCCHPDFPVLFGNVFGYLDQPVHNPNFRDGWFTNSHVMRITFNDPPDRISDVVVTVIGASNSPSLLYRGEMQIVDSSSQVHHLFTDFLDITATATLRLSDSGIGIDDVRLIRIGGNNGTVAVDLLAVETSPALSPPISPPIPAPGAALLAMLGLPLVGWVKRRSG